MLDELSYRGFIVTAQDSDLHPDGSGYTAKGEDDGEGPLLLACTSLQSLIAGIDDLLGATEGAITAQQVIDRTPAWYTAWMADGCLGPVWIPDTELRSILSVTTQRLMQIGRSVSKPLAFTSTFVGLWSVISDSVFPGLVDLGVTATHFL